LFVLTLGYSVTLRIFAREKRLLAIEQELEIARRIQTAILPKEMPLTQGVDIAVRYSPMTEVAGDFYDFLVLDSSRLGLLVADVSGHGVPAALVASMVKVGFGVQRSHASDPSRVLAGLNQVLYGQLDGQFVTAGYLYIDTERNKLRYAGAAHPPLLRCNRATGKVEALEENGLMLGPFPEPRYQNVEIEFNAGERIVLVTDGILEAADASGEFFGEERLREFVAGHSRLGAESFADELLQEVTRWSASDAGAEQSDDITLAVVDIGGLPSSRREPIATNAEENDHSDRLHAT
jgi:serine phosphatase RsbU (regulator of sigma subunit)